MGLMSGAKQVVIDAWSWLNYKDVYSDARGVPSRRAFPEAAMMWVPDDARRRLAAYKLLTAYLNNQSAALAEITDGPEARDRREFGDPSMFCDTVVAHVLGREQHIVVPGAEHAGQDPADGADTSEVAAARTAERVQDLLRTWAEAELLPMRMLQCEKKTVSMGDGIYRLAWDPGKNRVTVRVCDPGFYFPVLSEDGDNGDYPTRVHFAWELPEDPKRDLPARLRRITYELAPIGPATATGVDENSRPVRATVMADTDDGPMPVLGQGDQADPDTGTITRQYAWNDQPSTLTCYLTDATWLIEDLKGPNLDVDNLPLDKAHFATRSDGEVLHALDLLIDFIPVVHVPNTVPDAEEHWGTSSLAKVLQVLDELQAADTDASRASATTGLPIVGISGAADSRAEYRIEPGAVWTMGPEGRLQAVDTSPALRELREHRHDLADRAANIARLPAVTLGTLDPSKVPSGYAMQLSLGPLDSMVGSMRLARDHKESLLLKMIQRLHHAGQHPDWTGLPVLPARLVRGPYTPTDKAAVLEQVGTGVDKQVLSLETGVTMLIEAGFPIDDAQQEIQRIQARQFEKARALADATGDTQLVGDFLGMKVTPPEQGPPVRLPDTGDGGEGAGNGGQQTSGGNT